MYEYNTFPYMIGLVSPKVHSIQSAVAQLQYILSFSCCFTTTSLILSHACHCPSQAGTNIVAAKHISELCLVHLS